MEIKKVPISDLSQDPANARKHPEKNKKALANSFKRFKAARSVVVDKNNVVRAGNGSVEAAAAAGVKEAIIIETNGDELVVVKRKDWNETEAMAYALADNQTQETSEWDKDLIGQQLAALINDKFEMDAIGFDKSELERLTRIHLPIHGLTPGDEAPAPPDVAKSKRGDLYILGEHRLLCGDSTNPEDVSRLMDGKKAALFSTDPPYLVDYTGKDRPNNSGKDWSDRYHEIEIKDAEGFLRAVFTNAMKNIEDRAAWYCWHAHKRAALIEKIWEEIGVLNHQQIVWVKPFALHSHSFYPWQHEPCLMGWKKKFKPEHDGDKSHAVTSVWAVNWEGKNKVTDNEHPTQKPIEIFSIPMRKHTNRGDVVFEPFSGSGSQLIAAEREGRICYAMEIEPKFVDVAIERWEKFTGNKAVLA